ncbi:MAG: M24 family metallopeptidase [Gemmatales bacterium]|nr:M24 family metallopeptidase [Gemmatales bacterium]MDW7994597.1 M24 family metallopeptidase [Gemmatales bacterium]
MNLEAIQSALRQAQWDGWLLCDFRGNNPLARRILGLPATLLTTRRWYYFIPAIGLPTKIVHRIESSVLDNLPGAKQVYLRWQDLEAALRRVVAGKRIALEYSPNNQIPYICCVDAGTADWLRSLGAELVSSADLVQQFEAVWTPQQWELHLQAAQHTDAAFAVAWSFLADQLRAGRTVRESDVQARIMDYFAQRGLVTDHLPIVAVGPHSGDPHYTITPHSDSVITTEQLVLIDLWAKVNHPEAVYSDLTRVAWTGPKVPARVKEIFSIVARARDAVIDRIQQAFRDGEMIQGWQLDEVARGIIANAGYGEFFVHRTGHNIGREVHGNGANLDNLETHDARRILPGTCFSVEPGIYLEDFGIRSEVNVFVDWHGMVHVTGGLPQTEVTPLLSEPNNVPRS